MRAGVADAMVAGVTCATARVIEAAMMTIGLSENVATPSSCFLISVTDVAEHGARTLLFADCAVNVSPTVEELADIGIASAESLRLFTGEEPRIAFLSFSTHGSAAHEMVDRVRAAAKLLRSRRRVRDWRRRVHRGCSHSALQFIIDDRDAALGVHPGRSHDQPVVFTRG